MGVKGQGVADACTWVIEGAETISFKFSADRLLISGLNGSWLEQVNSQKVTAFIGEKVS